MSSTISDATILTLLRAPRFAFSAFRVHMCIAT
jgi:hypothetical protein